MLRLKTQRTGVEEALTISLTKPNDYSPPWQGRRGKQGQDRKGLESGADGHGLPQGVTHRPDSASCQDPTRHGFPPNFRPAATEIATPHRPEEESRHVEGLRHAPFRSLAAQDHDALGAFSGVMLGFVVPITVVTLVVAVSRPAAREA